MDKSWEKVHSFSFQNAFTYADMRPGHTDREKRNMIREVAFQRFPGDIYSESKKWAFKIYVEKSGRRAFDIENVPKLIIDAFCKKRIDRDKLNDSQDSRVSNVALYPDDTIDHVVFLEVSGKRIDQNKDEKTTVDIFRLKK